MEEATELLPFMITQSGAFFDRYNSDGAVPVEGSDKIVVREGRAQISTIYPTVPREAPRGGPLRRENFLKDGEIDLTVIGQPPVLLPICFRRYQYEPVTIKLAWPVLPPLVMNVPVSETEETRKARPVPYYLRSIIVHHGNLPKTGHYLTYVPKPSAILPNGYPSVWEVRSDTDVREVTAETALRDILTNGTGYLYEKSPAV
jgi:hypothetical protein